MQQSTKPDRLQPPCGGISPTPSRVSETAPTNLTRLNPGERVMSGTDDRDTGVVTDVRLDEVNGPVQVRWDCSHEITWHGADCLTSLDHGPYRREPDPIVSTEKLSIDDDYGTETYIKTIFAETCLGLRRAVRELDMGSIPIYSDWDCTGLVCGQSCKFIKIYKCGRGFIGVVELTVSRDV